MKRRFLYIHGKGGSSAEAEHYKSIFPGDDVFGVDYTSQTPWEAREEFPRFFDENSGGYDSTIVVANSIGAYFTMCALADKQIDKAIFISPVVNMEKLIADMMSWANVTETVLRMQKEIPTNFGETLSWDYLCYVREHPIVWNIPTCILYGENDSLTSIGTISAFAEKTGAALTVMKGGEHWFHTEQQMEFLDRWITASV